MMAHCVKCGGEVNSVDLHDFAVDAREAREYRDAKLKVGDIVCATCMHIIMFPTLDKSHDLEDVPSHMDLDY
jgi:hypothetical protein